MHVADKRVLIKGASQFIWTEIPQPVRLAAATSITYRVSLPGAPIQDGDAFALVDENGPSQDSTIATAASEGAESLDIQDAANLETRPGYPYLITDAVSGESFVVHASSVDTDADPMYLREPLPKAVAVSSLIAGHYAGVDLDTAETADAGVGYVEWRAITDTMGGGDEEIRWLTPFEIVERVNPTYTLTATALTTQSPLAKQLRRDNDGDYTEIIDAAWRRYVRPALLAKQIRPENIGSPGELEPVHIAAVELLLVESTPSLPPDARQERKAAFVEAMDLALQGRDLWVLPESTQEPTAPQAGEVRPWITQQVFR